MSSSTRSCAGLVPWPQSLSRAALLGSTMLTASLLASTSAFAGTPQWLGTVSTDWFTAGNWSPAAVPTAGDAVTIDTTSPNLTVINGGAAAGQQIFVGNIGTGSLAIVGGGVLTSNAGTLGNFMNGNGTVAVGGAGSAWNNSGDLAIGNLGTGALNIGSEFDLLAEVLRRLEA